MTCCKMHDFYYFEEGFALDFKNVFENEDEIMDDLSQLSDEGREIILKHYGVKKTFWSLSVGTHYCIYRKNYKFIEERDELKKTGSFRQRNCKTNGAFNHNLSLKSNDCQRGIEGI